MPEPSSRGVGAAEGEAGARPGRGGGGGGGLPRRRRRRWTASAPAPPGGQPSGGCARAGRGGACPRDLGDSRPSRPPSERENRPRRGRSPEIGGVSCGRRTASCPGSSRATRGNRVNGQPHVRGTSSRAGARREGRGAAGSGRTAGSAPARPTLRPQPGAVGPPGASQAAATSARASLEAVDQQGDLSLGDHERRRDLERDAAQDAGQDPVAAQRGGDDLRRARVRREDLRVQLDRRGQPDHPRLARRAERRRGGRSRARAPAPGPAPGRPGPRPR